MSGCAVILAGGFGSRLAHVVSGVPKPMAPVAGKPFLDYIIENLKKQNFDRFIFLTGYKAEVIENHFKTLEGAVFIREDKPLGTGGAVLNALDKIDGGFFVINGDTFFDIDFSLPEEFSKDKPSLTALRYSCDVERYGFAEIDEDYKIKKFTEKGNLPSGRIDGYINGGIYYFKKETLKDFARLYKGGNVSLENEIIPELAEQGKMYGLPLGGCFIDIGVPEDYYRAQNLIPDWIKKEAKPALFIDKDGTLIENTQYPCGKNFKLINSAVDMVKSYADKNYHIIMVTNQAGIAKNKFSLDEMKEGFEEIKRVYKDFGIAFDDIEYCPYHKDGVIKEYAYDTILRKPDPGMILSACGKLKIDLKNSVMAGDNEDIDNIKLPYLKCRILKGEKIWT